MDCKLALFIDFENIARGVRQRHLEERVDLRAILGELEEKGRILIKRAYADWSYYKDYRSDLLQQGIEPVQVFAASRDREGWKNGADIRIAIDAIEAAYRSPEITDFALVTGDSDFLSLVNRLRENGKTVWGVGLKTSSSQYLVKSCDHYLFYEEVADWMPDENADGSGNGGGSRRDARTLLLGTIRRMTDRQGLPGMPPPGTPLKAMAVKASMRRLDPSWDERFEGFDNFIDFLKAQSDAILCGQPGEGSEYFVAERGTVAEANLQRMLEFVQASSGPAQPLPRDEVLEALRRTLRLLGSPDGRPDVPQRIAVRGTQLKTRLRLELPGFEESTYGYTSFLDFLLGMRDQVRVARADFRGDILVAERDSPAEGSISTLPEAVGGASGSWDQSPEQRYVAALRYRRIRHVPAEERYAIIRALCRIFEEARAQGEDLSLKEAKDRLHHWFEENEPSVPWESVNNVVYHLFWTYCFEFGEGDESVPLWDRPTCWQGGMQGPDEVIRRCDTGLVRMISEVVGAVEPAVVVEVLGDRNMSRLSYFEEVCVQVNQRFALNGSR